MPSSVTIVTAFVASPGDLSEDRGVLVDEVAQLNLLLSKNKVRLEVIGWETHTFPAVGEYPQGVINSQIGDSYDIFVGLMGTKFGTPTRNYGSGTEEEFERAYSRWKANPETTQIMFYFKSALVDPMTIDVRQLEKVRTFKERMSEAGVYFSTYSNKEQFVQQLRLHLTAAVQRWVSPTGNASSPEERSSFTKPQSPVTDANELGYLDHLELGLQAFQTATEAMERIGEANEEVGAVTSRRAVQFEELKRREGGFDPSAANKIVLLASEDMSHYAARLEGEIPIFSNAYKAAMEHVTSMAALSIEDFTPDFPALIRLRDVVSDHQGQADGAITNLNTLKSTISELPRISGTFNRAKLRTIKALTSLLAEMDFVKKLNQDAVSLLNTLIDQAPPEDGTSEGKAGEPA